MVSDVTQAPIDETLQTNLGDETQAPIDETQPLEMDLSDETQTTPVSQADRVTNYWNYRQSGFTGRLVSQALRGCWCWNYLWWSGRHPPPRFVRPSLHTPLHGVGLV